MKVAYYCIGNFSEFFYHSAKKSPYKTSFYLQNFKGLNFFKSKANDVNYFYLFENFNKLYSSKEKNQCTLNYNVIFQADKSHYKKLYNGNDMKNIIDTFYNIFNEILIKDKPDFIFFPIIESMDAMVLYELAREKGIDTIVYSHARILPFSFLSSNKFEEFPSYFYDNNHLNNSTDNYLEKLVKHSSRIKDQMKETILSIDADDVIYSPVYPNPIKRLLKNIYFKNTSERHNATLSNWVKFQVYFDKIFIYFQNILQRIVQKKLLKPLSINKFPKNYNFFPLHFSPESSINTPAPFYIDQERVIDEIVLLDSKPLLLREHPALYGKRPLAFYRNINKKPNVFFTKIDDDIYHIIEKSDKVFSVTGTVAIEAFFKGKPFIQFGRNYFSAFTGWCDDNNILKINRRRLLIQIIINNCSKFIILPHSPRNKKLNNALFSKININNFNLALDKYVQNSE
tara:strand:+ start:14300 stop:15664 length:1365 start_codon:yes stop_codon:yes gene_type:complete